MYISFAMLYNYTCTEIYNKVSIHQMWELSVWRYDLYDGHPFLLVAKPGIISADVMIIHLTWATSLWWLYNQSSCSPQGYKITITMNYLYSAFFCPSCQSLHDMYVYACMYIYDICIYMNVLMTATSSAQSLPVIMSVKKKWQKSEGREDGHGGCSVSLAAVLLAITNKARCRRLRVVTVIDITCHCCCCCVLLFFSVSETVSVPVVK